ncbi:Ethylene receptor [Gossypium arboreum]|uniref:Uncharacterized protein n=6 Tax=Gossypium TaxID=3633 RepID=A0ABR0QY23_GOSAR|nr:hypothetical protein ES319_A01G038200v1 [Gossypium barbadense]KAG4213218.1 hypothetical protein ERO13_A01G041400v2 [Gossypium hirsutum]KAK5844230.1 hypothetical protein PVK06_000366 [Gossypium arboreum]TYH29792.1 hypothetical protein ES288_A01G040300v1 [Gossypium darwinii]TYI41759.1 hypothetical protein ES332_A01G047600v1 [Gossypium tomentosum]TYJ48138.1 hypothetical protein E1A91_A01G039200v1 [Gossypium mustelinum]
MDACNCIEPQWPPDDLLMKYQYISDFFIALAYFSTPPELINLWTFTMHTRTVAMAMTTAVVSRATALMLVHIIPDVLSVKTRELFLKIKAAELDREMGLIRTQEET